MITVASAIKQIERLVKASEKWEYSSLEASLGKVLYEDYLSDIDMPPFQQSAMDGYAVSLHESSSYQLIGEIKAGDNKDFVLQKGEAVRIFTGAPVPTTANAVVMQEKVLVEGTNLHLQIRPSLHDHIRPKGEQIREGACALQKGTILSPAAVGFLASLGCTKVKVVSMPNVAILVTGNELAKPGTDLAYGQIFESNSLMLQAALKDTCGLNAAIVAVKDDYISTKEIIEKLLATNDFLLISGGISVGDYDFVGKALEAIGVEECFYKVKQKPGKPLFFGKTDKSYVFALPGNPAAALSCFHVYVSYALALWQHNKQAPVWFDAVSQSNFTKRGDRAQFLKAVLSNNEVTILEGQSSAMLQTFAVANALVYVPEDRSAIQKGELVKVKLIVL